MMLEIITRKISQPISRKWRRGFLSKAFRKCFQMPRCATFVTGMDRARQCLEVVPRLVRSKNRISISHLAEFLLYIQYMYAKNRIRMGTAQSCFQSNQA